MQVSGSNSSLPLSTQIIKKAGQAAQAPAAPVNPEQVNSAVDRASDRVNEAQASRTQNQADRRAFATQLYSANTQQKQIETYLAVASEGEIDTSSGSSRKVELADNAAAKVLDNAKDNGRQRPPVEATPYISVSA